MDKGVYTLSGERYTDKSGCVAFVMAGKYDSLVPHGHDFIEIAYVAGGCGVHEVDGKKIPTKKGDLFVLADWKSVHRFVPDGVSVYNNASGAVAAILPKGEGYFFTVSFTTPDTDGNISLNLPSWFTDLDLYIDNFFLCEGENVSVDLSGKPVLTEREIYADGNSSVTVPVRACGAVLKGVVLDGTPTEGYTADGEGVVLSAETVSSLGTGAFPCELVYEKDTLPFILYVGYAPGEIYCLDNVVNRYVNANEWMWKNEIVDGKAGRKWLHLYNEAAWLTILGIDANASFGWICFAFKPATTYTLSYDFYYDNIWSQPMSGSTRIVLSDSYTLCTLGADCSVTKGDAVSVGVENRGEYYTLSVTFVTPQTGNINLHPRQFLERERLSLPSDPAGRKNG